MKVRYPESETEKVIVSHSQKLFQIAGQLDKHTNYETSELDALIEVAESVGESWSGAWDSYLRESIYNKDFQPTDAVYKPGGEPQYGPYGVRLGPDWQTYSFNEVQQYINEKVGNLSIDRFSDDVKDATKAFKRTKSSALSFVYENFDTESDKFVQSWIGEIEELQIFAESDFIEFQRSLNQQASKNQNSSENKPNINMFKRRRSTFGLRVGHRRWTVQRQLKRI